MNKNTTNVTDSHLSRRPLNKSGPTFLPRYLPYHHRQHRRRHQRFRGNEDSGHVVENCALSMDPLFSCWKDPIQEGDLNLKRTEEIIEQK